MIPYSRPKCSDLWAIYIPYPRVNCLKTIPFTLAHTYIAHIWQYPHPPGAKVIKKWGPSGLGRATPQQPTKKCRLKERAEMKILKDRFSP